MIDPTFEEYMRDVHVKCNPTVQDDDLPDHFDHWIVELPVDDLLSWGTVYAKEQVLNAKEQMLDLLAPKRAKI